MPTNGIGGRRVARGQHGPDGNGKAAYASRAAALGHDLVH